MVTRKPVPPLTTSQPPASPSNTSKPPYPTSPPQSAVTNASANSGSVYSADLAKSPAFDLIDMREAQQRARSNSDSSHGTWDSDETLDDEDRPQAVEEEGFVEVPRPLNITPSKEKERMKEQTTGQQKEELPPSLRIGPAKSTVAAPPGHGYEEEASGNPWSHEPAGALPRSPGSNTKNPYLNLKQNGVVGDNINSQSIWQNPTPPPSMPGSAPPPPPSNAPPPIPSAPVELPTVKSPSQELEQMQLGENRPTSWETAERFSVPQVGQEPLPPVVEPQPHDERPVSTWWQDGQSELEGSQSAFAEPALPPPAPPPKQLQQEEELYQPPPGPPPGRLIDHEYAPANSSASKAPEPRPESPGTLLQKQRNPTYQIRHVNWLDESPSDTATTNGKSQSTLRNSPILTQNANGPCPLLALVNGLVLSTPHDVSTSLTQILSDREQISLGLLLDAVFDELMSERRAGASGELPDVSELYNFLLALHTGMNVNPRFVTPAATPRGSWDGVPANAKGMHPANKAQFKAGAFEETREMRLYSTFNIPLIHGWVAPAGTDAYDAFVRSAQTFEDAQNIQFAAFELEDKANSPEGLTTQEQNLLSDIKTIKSFLETWPTQLTDFGLETMSKSLQPGQIAILFRNDHFSTIYKEPRNGALMTLVTDTGYATHDEIVWESLVDVNGAASEMFSGDFRGVSHAQDVRLTTAGLESGAKASSPSSPPPPPLPGPRPTGNMPAVAGGSGSAHDDLPVTQMTEEQRKAAEQEDHDLALALQLQEEEEDRQRQDEQRRRREQELSEQFLSNESEGPRPPIPPRRNGGRGTNNTSANSVGTGATSQNPASTRPSGPPSRPSVTIPVTITHSSPSTAPVSRPPVNRPTDTQDDPDAPPSYEQAASDRPYRPAGSTASATLTQGNAIGAYDALRRQSAYAQQSQASLPSFADAGPASPPYTPQTPSAAGRRQSSGGGRNNSWNAQNQGGRRGSTQIGFSVPPQRVQPGQGGLAPGHFPGSMQARSSERLQQWNSGQRVPGGYPGGAPNAAAAGSGAPGVREAEDKCVVM